MSRRSALICGLAALAFCLVLFPATLPAQTHTVEIPGGDVSALITALEEAAARPAGEPTVIIVKGTYNFQFGDVPPPIESEVTIRGGGSGAVLTAVEGGIGTLFLVETNATLRLANLELSGFELDGALLDNSGLLELDRVQFSHNQGVYFCVRFGCRGGGPNISNREGGTMRLDRLSIVDSGTPSGSTFSFVGSVLRNDGQAEISNLQLYLSTPAYRNLISGAGSMRLSNASIFMRDGGPGGQSLFTDAPGHVEIENSIIAGFDAEWCAHVDSLGYNLVANPACSFVSDGDVVGQDPDLIWAPVDADWNKGGQQLLTHALVPLAQSVAVDSGSPDSCGVGGLVSQVRIPADGDGNGTGGCDRGAVERVPATVDMGGINGLFFNPDADGHYVYIAETTYPTMVMWTTFDDDGNQAWIFGIGDRVSPGGTFVADAYINLNGKVRLDGTLVPAESQPWGTMEVEMDTCHRGRLTYQSDVPGFGSGVFEFERLAIVDQIGCVEER